MKRSQDWRLSVRHIISLVGSFIAVALALALPQVSWSQTTPASLPCAWQTQVSGTGISNIAYPDTNATYWVMPVDTTTWSAAILTGQYTQSRFFSFTTYYDVNNTQQRIAGEIIDAGITPDPGSSNPFAPTPATASHNYTIRFDANATGSGNHVMWAPQQTTYLVYRVYVPNEALDLEGGVPLPGLSLVDGSGTEHALAQCSPATRVSNELKDLLGILQAGIQALTCPTSTPPSGAVTFALGSGEGGIFPNPVTKYYAARNLCLPDDKVIVVRGRAPDFPDTFNGGTIYQPEFPGSIQVRYWSLCNNKEVTPRPVVACTADHDTQLVSGANLGLYYTYVVSRDEGVGARGTPDWLPEGVNWLRWGDPLIQSSLVFRDMLPAADFALTGPYLPMGVYCDRSTLISQGWQQCFNIAGVTPP